ncbi:hypothetical protein CpipJ_CPIJ015141 [Culex quinquefasciatus]|uniref:Uncharacterized protein n=1 Tax=Culex quinquefasciatus TaxID=7176 RepID=B0X6I0_CULQU|nr:hypothetical protein CpipJ_CPIJ015141 [Culex quinquefasciatus]|eukprot:XP_001865252.1 hypothetical protein CpipJ_CPIJ015141 [Culex quinquefasciatus]
MATPSASSSFRSNFVYIYDIPWTEQKRLTCLLDQDGKWVPLALKRMGYGAVEVELLARIGLLEVPMENLLHLLACRFPLVLVIFVNRNPATAAISEPDPLKLLLNLGAFLSGINDIFVRFYSRLLYIHLLDLLQSFAPFLKVPVSNTNEPSATGPAETGYYVIECWDCRTKSNLATFSPVLVQHVESPASSGYASSTPVQFQFQKTPLTSQTRQQPPVAEAPVQPDLAVEAAVRRDLAAVKSPPGLSRREESAGT